MQVAWHRCSESEDQELQSLEIRRTRLTFCLSSQVSHTHMGTAPFFSTQSGSVGLPQGPCQFSVQPVALSTLRSASAVRTSLPSSCSLSSCHCYRRLGFPLLHVE